MQPVKNDSEEGWPSTKLAVYSACLILPYQSRRKAYGKLTCLLINEKDGVDLNTQGSGGPACCHGWGCRSLGRVSRCCVHLSASILISSCTLSKLPRLWDSELPSCRHECKSFAVWLCFLLPALNPHTSKK